MRTLSSVYARGRNGPEITEPLHGALDYNEIPKMIIMLCACVVKCSKSFCLCVLATPYSLHSHNVMFECYFN